MVDYTLITGMPRPRWKEVFRKMELGEELKFSFKDFAMVSTIRASVYQVNMEHIHDFTLFVDADFDRGVVSVGTKLKDAKHIQRKRSLH